MGYFISPARTGVLRLCSVYQISTISAPAAAAQIKNVLSFSIRRARRARLCWVRSIGTRTRTRVFTLYLRRLRFFFVDVLKTQAPSASSADASQLGSTLRRLPGRTGY